MKGNFFAGSVADGFLHDARRRRNDVTLRASNFTKIDWTMEILQSSAPIQYSISLTVRRRPLFLKDVMAAKQISIFVLDVAKRESFAFEAEHASAAEDLIRSPWFVTALGDYCATKQVVCNTRALFPRAATATEAAVFVERASEFQEAVDRILVARLTPS
jgi:hypothetical protein